MLTKYLISALIAFGIGALCGKFEIPLPAPPHWFGVVLIAAIWVGFFTFKPTA